LSPKFREWVGDPYTMKKTFGVTLAAVVLILGFMAGRATAQTVNATCMTKEAYMGVAGAMFADKYVEQCDATVALKKGTFLNLWGSKGLPEKEKADQLKQEKKTDDFSEELDVTFGGGHKLGRANLNMSVAYFVVHGKDVANMNVGLRVGILDLRVEGYTPTQKGGPHKGLMLIMGLSNSAKVSERLTVSASANLRNDSGAFGFDNTTLAQGSFGVNIGLTKSTSLLVGADLSKPLTTVHDGRQAEFVWKFGLLRGFNSK
jgi:hypothetical protein